MLATVLGCVCLGIASIIYLVVSCHLFYYGLQYSSLNVVKANLLDERGREEPADRNKEDAISFPGAFVETWSCGYEM